jgi:UDP-glucose 4-epimerase
LVTGGAGFIGSHIVDKLMKSKCAVIVLDNLSTGKPCNIQKYLDNPNFKFIRGDLGKIETIQNLMDDVGVIFHIAACPEVRVGNTHPEILYQQNIANTYLLLEYARRKANRLNRIYFMSTSTVYGEPGRIPTPEDYGPLLPISAYGASKLACEAMISSYCNSYGLRGQLFRLANVVGLRSNHGVIWDFVKKIKSCTDNTLEILGDGTQSKSYIHVSDCISCIFCCLMKQKEFIEVYNVGSVDKIDVISMAQTIGELMGKASLDLKPISRERDGRGWKGDVKTMQLDVTKVLNLGWKPTMNSREAVVSAANEILETIPR